MDFLQGHSLSGNVTVDNYLSLTSPEVQDFLFNFLPRYNIFKSPLSAGTESVTEKKAAGMTRIQVLVGNP